MGHQIKYLKPRGDIFYYVRRLPKSVLSNPALHQEVFGGKDLYRVSLGTSDQDEALQRFQIAHAGFDEKLQRFSPSSQLGQFRHNAVPVSTPLSPELLAEIKQRVARGVSDRWLRKSIAAEISPDHADIFEDEVEWREQLASELKLYLTKPATEWTPGLPNIDEIAQEWITFRNIQLEHPENDLSLIKNAVRSGLLQGERSVDQILENGAGNVSDLAPARTFSAGPSLSTVFEGYLSVTTHRKTRLEASGAFKRFTELAGEILASDVDHKLVLAFCKSEASKVVGSKAAASIKRPISQATIKKKLSFIRSAFELAISRGEFDGFNPIGKINVGAFTHKAPVGVMPDKRPLRPTELAELFSHPWFTGCKDAKSINSRGEHRLDRMHYWVPVVAALTGMRAAEIAGLKISEIKIDDKFPHIEVRPNEFRSIKNGKTRLVPILDQLDELGFSDFVCRRQAAGDIRLFEDISPPGRAGVKNTDGTWANAKIFRSFNRSVIPKALSLAKEASSRQEVTFHSLRGSFKTMLSHHAHGISEHYILDVIGHAKPQLDKSYRPEISIENLYSALLNCRYQGFEFPRLPNP